MATRHTNSYTEPFAAKGATCVCVYVRVLLLICVNVTTRIEKAKIGAKIITFNVKLGMMIRK